MEINRPKSRQPIPEHAKKVFSGVVFDTYQWEQELFDGRKVLFEKVKRPDTVAIFPVLPDGRIILTEQEQPCKPPFVTTAGGRVDRGEGIEEAARRELLEESGYEAGRLILWDAQQPYSKIEWSVFTFIAKDIKKVGEMDLDGGEKIKLKLVTFEEFLDICTSDDFTDHEITLKLMQAQLDPIKMEELRKAFDPNN